MTPKRRALWAAILLTSAPLHLVYNSVFSQSWTRQAYEAALVTPDFIDGAPFVADYYGSDLEALFEEIQANSSTYQRLEPMECLKAYNKKAILDRKTVLVVTSLNREDGSRNSVWTVDSYVGNEVLTGLSWSWMCDRSNYEVDGCDLTDVLEGRKEWKPFQTESTVDYCLSEYLGEQCTLDFCKLILR